MATLSYGLVAAFIFLSSSAAAQEPSAAPSPAYEELANLEDLYAPLPGVGPSNWGLVYPLCDESRPDSSQSPINIVSSGSLPSQPQTALSLIFESSATMNLTNAGESTMDAYPTSKNNTLLLELTDSGDVIFEAYLDQFHFHTFSEHSLNELHYSMECHLVYKVLNQGNPDQEMVVAIWFEEGGSTNNTVLQFALDNKPQVLGVSSGENVYADVLVPDVDLATLFEPYIGGHFAAYNGSLTTPPCTEGVEWVVFLEPQPVTSAQIDEFEAYCAMAQQDDIHNERPEQPLHGRKISFY